MLTKRQQFYSLPILILLFTLLFLGLWGASHYKQLYNDGAYWAFDVVNNRSWHIEYNYRRYFTLLVQTPAVMAANLSSSVALTVLLFCLGYLLYPFLTLGAIWGFARKSEKKDFFYIFILTLFVSIVPNWAFGVSIVNESIATAWMLLSYIVFSQRPKLFLVSLFALLLFFTYESAITFYFLAIYILFREKKLRLSLLAPFFVLTCFQVYNFVYWLIPRNAHMHFKTSFPIALEGTFFKYALGVACLMALAWFKKIPSLILLICAIALSGYGLYEVYHSGVHHLWGMSYFDRTWAVPSALGLLFLGYELCRRYNFTLPPGLVAGVAVLFLPALYLEARLNAGQVKFHSNLKQAVASHPGCYVMDRNQWEEFLDGTYVATWSFPHMSILYNESLQPKSVLFTNIHNEKGDLVPNEFCKLHDGHIIVKDQFGYYPLPTYRAIDFKEVYGP